MLGMGLLDQLSYARAFFLLCYRILQSLLIGVPPLKQAPPLTAPNALTAEGHPPRS